MVPTRASPLIKAESPADPLKYRFFMGKLDDRMKVSTAPLAQLDRASGFEPDGRAFESLRAHHQNLTRRVWWNW